MTVRWSAKGLERNDGGSRHIAGIGIWADAVAIACDWGVLFRSCPPSPCGLLLIYFAEQDTPTACSGNAGGAPTCGHAAVVEGQGLGDMSCARYPVALAPQ